MVVVLFLRRLCRLGVAVDDLVNVSVLFNPVWHRAVLLGQL